MIFKQDHRKNQDVPRIRTGLRAFLKRYREELAAAEPFWMKAELVACCESLLNEDERGGRGPLQC